MEIPGNISLKHDILLSWLRPLAEPGAGWWNNLFLVKKDGSLWIRLTDFKPSDRDSVVLYPKFSRDGKMVAWAERVGGARPFDKYPFARWVLKIAKIDVSTTRPCLSDIKTYSLQDGGIFEPQEWSRGNKLIFAADIGYFDLPYPAYRLDIWEAAVDDDGTIGDMKNLTNTKDYYEEQSSYSPDEKFMAFMANLFDQDYGKRLDAIRSKTTYNKFITTNLSTALYLMERKSKRLCRITYFSDKDWNGNHAIVTRSAWREDGKTRFVALSLRSNRTGKKTSESIYRVKLA